MRAIWHNHILAQSDETIVIENNHYFPAETLNMDYFQPSDTTSECAWKGTAHYYSIVVGDEQNLDAAWYYPAPKAAAKQIKNYVAFWRGVDVIA